MELIVGDAVISNPFRFNIGTVILKFPEPISMEGSDKNISYKQKPNVYITKPEIKVIFLNFCYTCVPMLVSGRNFLSNFVTSKTLAKNYVKVSIMYS